MKYKILLVLLASTMFEKIDITGEYRSWQCGELLLEINRDSTFKLNYSHFDIDYSRISTGTYTIYEDTLFLFELSKYYDSSVTLDTIQDKKRTYLFIIENNCRLKNQSLFCGAYNARLPNNWAYFEKER